MSGVAESITVTEDGLELPVIEVLTGRGFVTGKSGSGKSNTASVVAEELLENGFPLLIVDTDGEYLGLTERYEMLHVGTDEDCDVPATPEEADQVVDLALTENIPVILDVSGFVEGDEANEVVHAVVERLFAAEKDVRKPFLLLIEEMHEFVPEQGGLDDLGEMLVRVAKRGRKRGLGVCGMSQRPAAVDKDFITQCDWIVWHRLTWNNDTAVVSSVLGNDAADTVSSLDVGEALLMTDWDEGLRRVQFRKKRSADVGATPDLERFDDESLTSAKHSEGGSADGGGEESTTVDEGSGEGAGSHGTGGTDPLVVQDTTPPTRGGRSETASGATEPSASPGPPRKADADAGPVEEEFDPVWEIAHLVVYVVTAVRRALWGAVLAVEGRLAAALGETRIQGGARGVRRSHRHPLAVRFVAIALVAGAVAGAVLLVAVLVT